MSVSNTKTRTKTRWTREFKLQALSRMEAAGDVTALAAELGCRRELLYIWRRKVRSGGAEALHPIGRPSHVAKPFDEALAPSSAGGAGSEQRQIEELQRKIGQQQLDLDFFRAALRHVREARPKKGAPGGTASTR
jgi:transposase-like protein